MATITTREVGATAKGSPLTNAEVDQNFINLNEQFGVNLELQKDLIGFANRTSSTLAFNEGTRTLTLTPTSTTKVYRYGTEYEITSAKTIVITNTSGGRYIKFDPDTQELVEVGAVGSFPDFKSDILVSYIYWDASNQKAIIVGDERHGVDRDTQWHYSQHLDVGAIWRSGGAASYVLDSQTTYRIGLSAPIGIADEDINISITHSASPVAPFQQTLESIAVLPVVYLSGTSYVQQAPLATQWYIGTNTAYFNQLTGSSGSLVEAADNKYIVYWVVATNDIYYPVKLIMGHFAHNQLTEAEAETFGDYGLPVPELVPMHKVILQTSINYTNKVIVRQVSTVTGRQSTALLNIGSAVSHDTLLGKSLADQHPIGAITGLQTTLDGKENVGVAVSLAIALG